MRRSPEGSVPSATPIAVRVTRSEVQRPWYVEASTVRSEADVAAEMEQRLSSLE